MGRGHLLDEDRKGGLLDVYLARDVLSVVLIPYHGVLRYQAVIKGIRQS
jgi:hypothetical protein